MGMKIIFERHLSTNTDYQENRKTGNGGEQCISGLVGNQNIMTTQYQQRAMPFIPTLHNLITFISHCIIYIHTYEHHNF